MNERIRELMGKTLDDKFSHTWDTMTHEGLLQFAKKFAELIVKECADAADMAQEAGCEYAGDYVAEYMGYGQEEGVTEWRAK